MIDQLMDVHLELDPLRLAEEPDPTRTIAELSRHTAEANAGANGATLRHPDPREIHVRQARDPLSGRDVMLVATRWVVDTH